MVARRSIIRWFHNTGASKHRNDALIVRMVKRDQIIQP